MNTLFARDRVIVMTYLVVYIHQYHKIRPHEKTSGEICGLRGCSPRIIRSGDTVWIPPEEEHWHGAGPDTMMCHLAIQEALDGKVANWMEHVSDAEYSMSPM